MSSFKTQFWRISKWFGAVFILLFIFRFIYGYVAGVSDNQNSVSSEDFFGSIENLRKNYASEKIFIKGTSHQAAPQITSNQKFEKTASVKTKSSEFDRDEKLIKGKTKSYGAIIQYEQNVGQQGSRQLHLVIGVDPSKFDSFYVDIQKIGHVKTKEITKVDKTNEYRQLNAKKVSIEKTLQSLNELKSRGGQITDFISLNDKILETEEKLQELGVELGNFDSENEFCTVKLSLYEGSTVKSITVIHRVKVALEWAIKYFAIIVFTSLILSITAFVLILIINKLKVMNILKQ